MSDSSRRDFQDLNSSAVPFFARYLEGQFCEDLSEQEMEAISGGNMAMTKRYPSDSDDGTVVTLAYPSDQEIADPNLGYQPELSLPDGISIPDISTLLPPGFSLGFPS
jgi:Serine endopeptidase inhibitors